MSADVQKDKFIEDLYRTYYTDLKRYSYHYFHNDSKFTPCIEDCIQETFEKAILNYEKLLNHENVAAWLFTTCGNELCKHLRKYVRYRKRFEGSTQIEVESAEAYRDDLERWICQHDAEDEIRMIYKALTPLEQRIFDDYYTSDQSLKETAAKHGLTENAVHCGAKRIRRKATEIVKSDFIIIFLIKTTFHFFRID